MLPADGILGVAPSWGQHLVEGGHAIALLELADVLADFVHDARDVVALVRGGFIALPFWVFPSSC